MSHGGDGRSGPPRREEPWWSDDTPSNDAGAADLPAWAARNLTDPGQDRIMTRTPTSRRRQVVSPAPSRMRGWGLAVVALAAAAGAVPLAVSTLAQQDAPLPRVGAFPVSSPGDLAGHGDGQPRRPVPTGSEYSVFAEPAPAQDATAAPVAVVPLARSRPTVTPRPPVPTVTRAVPASPRVAPPRPVAPRPAPRSAVRPPSDDESGSTPSTGHDESEGGGRSGSSSGSGSNSGSGSSSGGLVGGLGRTVDGVAGTVGSVLN